MEQKRINLLDVAGPRRIAGFNRDYLNLEGASPDMARSFDDRERAQRSCDERRSGQ